MNNFAKLLLLTTLTPLTCAAIMCPTNFSQIDFGFTTEQVTQLCGKPDAQETKDMKPDVPEEWVYYTSGIGSSFAHLRVKGNFKATITLDATGHVVNIATDQINNGINATQICNSNVSVGDTREQVRTACGNPAYINRKEPDPNSPAPEPKKIVTFIYNTTPQTKLIFENGKLKERQ